MALPQAVISHRLPTRLRLKIASRRGDRAYFTAAAENLVTMPGVDRLEANPATGSVLMIGKDLDPSAIADAAERRGLFTVAALPARGEPLSRRITEPLGRLSGSISRFTRGDVDLPGLVFMALLATGVVQIARGNFRAPPWYTAFWYAMGVFTKSLVDRKDGDEE